MRIWLLVVLVACSNRYGTPSKRTAPVVWKFDRRELDLPQRRADLIAATAPPTNRQNDDRYSLDGVDTTDVRTGVGGTLLPMDLLDSITVVRTGVPVAYGRGLGGDVALATRHGEGDVFHGSVFGSIAPGALAADPVVDPRQPTSIRIDSAPGYSTTFGAELSGPIVRNHAWFYVGIAPTLSRVDHTRTIQRYVDCRKSSDPGALCVLGSGDGNRDVDPRTGYDIVEPLASEVREETLRSIPIVGRVDMSLPNTNVSASLVAVPYRGTDPELFGAATAGRRLWGESIDATARVQRYLPSNFELVGAIAWHRRDDNTGAIDPRSDNVKQVFSANLGAPPGCDDDVTPEGPDPYPQIVNCSLFGRVGGPGSLRRDSQDRRTIAASLSGRLLGHFATVGLAGAAEETVTAHVYSGGEIIREAFFGLVPARIATLRDDGTLDVVGGLEDPDAYIGATSKSFSAYAEDMWKPSDNTQIEAGVRYEGQRMHDIALDALSPRIGVTWDPSERGRTLVFANLGRYHEFLPTQIVDERLAHSYYIDGDQPLGSYPFEEMRVDPNLRPGYVDAFSTGAMFEIAPQLTLGAIWERRRLGRAIEDTEDPDGAGYVLTNPAGAVREHDSFVFSIARQQPRYFLSASYTFTRARGNYAGAGIDSTAHDAPVLDIDPTSSIGALAFERPHDLKLDAAYTRPFSQRSLLILGSRFRGSSGTPRDVTNDRGESLLPPGTFGRTPFASSLDVHVAFRRQMSRRIVAEVYADVLNIIDSQSIAAFDDASGRSSRPISGGTLQDYIWVEPEQFRNTNFGKPTSRYAPRSALVGARVRF